MKAIGKFLLLDLSEFDAWLDAQQIKRKISLIQQHHTFIPAYKHFNGSNHFTLCQSMEQAHKERGFAEIAQNFTSFPDGKIMVCRSLNTIPAGIKGVNTPGICIENVGNFDRGKDSMSSQQKECIVHITRSLLTRFKLAPGETTVVYHHWFDLNTGKRILKEGAGSTKTCPGTNFFGGNTVEAFKTGLLPLL
ncbi:MAG: N-acetylmuramoyl-L-alanine amidase [Paludibacter sp.]|nr:N-acetylmuramoyl-L-alanine amidase [Paludibacter sp.]